MTFIPPAYAADGQLQRDALARNVGDVLFPNLLFRAGVFRSLFPATVGTALFQPVSSTLKPKTKPSIPGVTPTPTAPPRYEYYKVKPEPYRDVIPMSMPLNYGSAVGPYWDMKHKQVLQAAQSLNRICRNSLFRCYQYGHAIVDTVAGGGITVTVSSLNGFIESVDPTSGYPVATSSQAPRSVLRNGVAITAQVIGFAPLVPGELNGPGTLTFSAANPIVAGDILSTPDASKIVRPNGVASVDGIGPADGFSLDLINRAVTHLRNNSISPFADGNYHVHLEPTAQLDLSRLNQVQRQIETRGLEDEAYRRLAYAGISGCLLFSNVECPGLATLDPDRVFEGRPTSAPAARTSAEIGAEVINASGVPIMRAIVMGAESVVESWVDENNYITEAGLLGKVEARAAQNMGIEIYADGIRFIDQAPTDIFHETIQSGWSWTGDFACPTNRLTSRSGASYARAVVIECALSQV